MHRIAWLLSHSLSALLMLISAFFACRFEFPIEAASASNRAVSVQVVSYASIAAARLSSLALFHRYAFQPASGVSFCVVIWTSSDRRMHSFAGESKAALLSSDESSGEASTDRSNL